MQISMSVSDTRSRVSLSRASPNARSIERAENTRYSCPSTSPVFAKSGRVAGTLRTLVPCRLLEPGDDLLVHRMLRARGHLKGFVEDVRAELFHLAEPEQPVQAHLELGCNRGHGIGAGKPVHLRGEKLGKGGAIDPDPARERRPRRPRPPHRLRQPGPEDPGHLSPIHLTPRLRKALTAWRHQAT